MRHMKLHLTLLGLLTLTLPLLVGSCSPVVVNSAMNDKLIASVANLQGGTKFKLIVPTLIDKCASCHQHQSWYGFNETDYSAQGLVIQNDHLASKLYYRLSATSDGTGPHDMPQGGGAGFTETEVQLLVNWIDNFGT